MEATSRKNRYVAHMVNRGEGTVNFQTAIVIMKCCFCLFFLVLFRWIVILSTDIRLGVKNGGFIFR